MADVLRSERVVVAAPMSYAGAWNHSWNLTRRADWPWKAALVVAAIALVLVWWAGVTAWYMTWGLLLVPYRMIRRGSRKRKVEALRHRELLSNHPEREVLAHAKEPGGRGRGPSRGALKAVTTIADPEMRKEPPEGRKDPPGGSS